MLITLPSLAAAQQGTTLSGTITQGDGGQPMAGALVIIDELRRETRTDEQGHYRFDGVPPGSYHVGVRAEGYTTRRTEVTVGDRAGAARHGGGVRPALRRSAVGQSQPAAAVRVVSADVRAHRAGPDAAARLHGGRHAAVRARHRHALVRRRAGAAGDPRSRRRPRGRARGRSAHGRHLQPVGRPRRAREPGGRAQGRSRPRVRPRCCTAPTRSAVSSTSSPTRFRPNPPLAHRAISRSISAPTAGRPAAPATCTWATVSGRFTSAAADSGWATTARRRARPRTPQSRTATTSLGGAWTGEHSYVGASYGYTDMKYGIPVVEEGQISLTPRRHAFNIRAGGSALPGIPPVLPRHPRRPALRAPGA